MLLECVCVYVCICGVSWACGCWRLDGCWFVCVWACVYACVFVWERGWSWWGVCMVVSVDIRVGVDMWVGGYKQTDQRNYV